MNSATTTPAALTIDHLIFDWCEGPHEICDRFENTQVKTVAEIDAMLDELSAAAREGVEGLCFKAGITTYLCDGTTFEARHYVKGQDADHVLPHVEGLQSYYSQTADRPKWVKQADCDDALTVLNPVVAAIRAQLGIAPKSSFDMDAFEALIS